MTERKTMTSRDDLVRNSKQVWKHVVDSIPLNEERKYSTIDVAAGTHISVEAAGRHMRFLRGLGLISYRSSYKGVGQEVFTTRLMTLEDGNLAIYQHFDSGKPFSLFETTKARSHHAAPRRETVVVADERSTEEVRAIAGPEPVSPMAALAPMRKSEPEALIEAARQYVNRSTAVQRHVEELRALGVEVDVDMVMKGIKLTSDPVLDAIAQILPVLDRWERRAMEGKRDVAALRDELADLRKTIDPLRDAATSLKAANKRLSERNVALTAARSGSLAFTEVNRA